MESSKKLKTGQVDFDTFKTANFLDATSSIQGQFNALNTKSIVLNQTSDISSNTTTLVNTNITFNVEANATYFIQGWIIGGGNSSGGIRVGFSLPSGCTGSQAICISTNVSPSGMGSATLAFAPAINAQQSLYNGILITGSTAGTATLQFSSAVGGQTGWFRTNTIFIVTKK